MRLSELVTAIVRADACYFLENGFIRQSLYHAVQRWLEGGDDKHVRAVVAGWLDSDARYFRRLACALLRHHWYIFPVMLVLVTVVPKRLQKYADYLREEGSVK